MAAAAKKKAARKSGAAKKNPNILAFVGSDEARLKEAALEKFRELVPPEEADFGAEVIDGVAENAEGAVRIVTETIGALQTMPFFGGKKVVWLKSANLFADSQTGKAQSVLDAAEALGEVLAAGLPDGVVFLLSAVAIDKRRSFYKKLNKAGTVQAFDRADMGKDDWQNQVAPFVRGEAKRLGLEFDSDALELFVMLAGDDAAQIGNELEKIDLFLGPGERRVDAELVKRHVALTRAGVVFDLGNCLARRDLAGALGTIDHLIYQGENPIGILLAAVAPKLRQLLIARELADVHGVRANNYRSYEAAVSRLPKAAIYHLPRKKDGGLSVYPIFLASGQAGKFTVPALREGLAECLRANRALVTSALDPRLVLERLLVRLLSKSA